MNLLHQWGPLLLEDQWQWNGEGVKVIGDAMDKSLKVGEDEWREKERRSTKFYASNEV